MNEQQFHLFMETLKGVNKNIEAVKVDLRDFKKETKESIKDISDRLINVQDYVSSKRYFWDTTGKILTGGASFGAIIVVILKLFNVF